MKQTYSIERIKALKTPAVLSKFIVSIDQLKPGPVVLYGRVSSQTQKNNLPHQINSLKTDMERRGFNIIAVYREVIYGWEEEQTEFGLAILKAKVAGVPVVARSADRFRRCWRYCKKDKMPSLNLFEINRLMEEADGVVLATLLHPDTPPNKVRSDQTKTGQAGKGNCGGRPAKKFPKKAKREENMLRAISLRQAGLSYRKIGHRLHIAWSTIRDWTKKKPHTVSHRLISNQAL